MLYFKTENEREGDIKMKPVGFLRKYVPVFAWVSLAILAVCAVCYAIAINNSTVANSMNDTVGLALRFLLAKITGWLPFSLFELLLICVLPLLVIFVVWLVRTKRGAVARVRSILCVLSVIAIILSSYVFTLGVGYRTPTLSQKIGVEDVRNIERDELFSVTHLLVEEVNTLSDEITYRDGVSVMPYDFREMCHRLCDAYDTVAEKYSALYTFDSTAKPVLFSTVMSDAGIIGIYSFFTGESNVNVEYPDYTTPFTTAHEMAHQRGIARENEANFIAFLVCISSDDAYIRYSGYLGMLEYFLSAAYSTDKAAYPDLFATVSERAIEDIISSNAVTLAHKDSLIGKINDKLNDNYLKFNGTEGVISYGYVVRLTVGYYRQS